MYIGNLETKQLISIALMILFFGMVMFFIGYKYAYNNAINYANEQIDKKINEVKIDLGITSKNPDFIIGNIEIPIGGDEDVK